MSKQAFTVRQLAAHVGARFVGDGELEITGLGSLERAAPGELSHLSSAPYRRFLRNTNAGAVLLREADLDACPCTALVVANPYHAFARLSAWFDEGDGDAPGVHSTASVSGRASLGANVSIGPGAVIEGDACVGDGTKVGASSFVGAGVVLGDRVRLWPNVTLYHGVSIGADSRVHSGAVIGSDGFGYAPDERGRLEKIAQIGSVRVGCNVEIGANTTIDRGAIDDTVIGDGVKIDNQVQIGHNVEVGDHTVICGCVGIVGSTRIGKHCVLAGGVGVGGDGPIELADHVVVSGMTHVSRSIDRAGQYSSGTLHSPSLQWKRNALRFLQLDQIVRRLKRLEKALEKPARDSGQ